MGSIVLATDVPASQRFTSPLDSVITQQVSLIHTLTSRPFLSLELFDCVMDCSTSRPEVSNQTYSLDFLGHWDSNGKADFSPLDGTLDQDDLMSPDFSRAVCGTDALRLPWPIKMFSANYHVQRGIQYRRQAVELLKATAMNNPNFSGNIEATDLAKRNKKLIDALRKLEESRKLTILASRHFKRRCRGFYAHVELSSQNHEAVDLTVTLSQPRHHSSDESCVTSPFSGRSTPVQGNSGDVYEAACVRTPCSPVFPPAGTLHCHRALHMADPATAQRFLWRPPLGCRRYRIGRCWTACYDL
ncbi:hypothetical protein C8Q76DRAFT_25330 [Earliella scabrosa]|nr:hypothetical protein C8Q76DRAFT_25330 [Earliella scabrosa]